MSGLVVRRRPASGPSLLGPALLALGLGAVAGFVLGEYFGPAAERTLAGTRRRAAPTLAELVHDAQAALDADPTLASLGLDVLPVSRQSVELHGWVPSRALRTRAHRAVRDAIGTDAVINCLLVRGEDDAVPPALDILTA
jgi:hypothetical protein